MAIDDARAKPNLRTTASPAAAHGAMEIGSQWQQRRRRRIERMIERKGSDLNALGVS